jgi:hypothetical protein
MEATVPVRIAGVRRPTPRCDHFGRTGPAPSRARVLLARSLGRSLPALGEWEPAYFLMRQTPLSHVTVSVHDILHSRPA